MQIPLVESRLALSYSSWFSDLGFAFFVRWLQVSALFDFGGMSMKKILMAILVVLTLFCFVACNDTNSITCPECGYENEGGVKFCSDCGASMASSNDDNQNNNNGNNNNTSCQHSFGEWSEKVAAGCTNTGTMERACSKCSHKETETIAALGHTTTTGVCERCNVRQGWSENEVQSLIKIYDIFVSDIDSADGVDMTIAWENSSSKTIKYIYFSVEAYNAVDDRVSCNIRDYYEFTGELTGPFESGYTNMTYDSDDDRYRAKTLFEECYYNPNIKYFKLTNIRIVYMDNTEFELEEEYIDYAFSDLPNGLTYLWNEELNGYEVEWRLKEKCTLSNITIPSTHNGKKVVAINNYAFSNCINLKYIEIPSSVEEIGSFAFENCSKLNKIFIPDNVKEMGYAMLNGCDNLKEISVPFLDFRFGNLFVGVPESLENVTIRGGTVLVDGAFENCDSIKQIILPNTITTIGEKAFAECSSLETIKIPKSVISIGRHAFYKCASLEEIIIPNGVENIDDIAFVYCTNLKKIVIPRSVETVGYHLFSGSANLTIYCETISQPSGWDNSWNYYEYPVVWGYVQEPNTLYYTLSEDETYYIVAGIGSYSDTDLVIPETYKGKPIKEIGESAFEYNSSIKSVSIPGSIVKIGDSAFYYCENIERINIGVGVINIGIWAFKDCSKLVEIVIPSSITSIDSCAFSGCNSLSNIIVDANNTIYQSISGNLYSKDGKILIQYAIGKQDTSFRIPETVTSISDYAFLCCETLITVIIPNNVTSIGWDVFSGCVNLTIYCSANNRHAGWDTDWNYCFEHTNGTDYCTVIWGYTEN